jgi:hypothetical protein
MDSPPSLWHCRRLAAVRASRASARKLLDDCRSARETASCSTRERLLSAQPRAKTVQDHIDELPMWVDGTLLSAPPMTRMQWRIWSLAAAVPPPVRQFRAVGHLAPARGPNRCRGASGLFGRNDGVIGAS